MRFQIVCAAALISACSAGGATAAQYERAIECEVTTGVVGAFLPGLSRDRVAQFQSANRRFNEQTETLGQRSGKTPPEIDDDRREFLETQQQRLTGSTPDAAAQELIRTAESCLQS